MIFSPQTPNLLMAAPLKRILEQIISLGGPSPHTVKDSDWRDEPRGIDVGTPHDQ